MDTDKDKNLTYAEVQKGLIDDIKLPVLFDLPPVLRRAFDAAVSDIKKLDENYRDEISNKNYRLMLKYVRQYYEFWAAFEQIDISGDREVSYEEFTEAKPWLERWNIDMSDPDSQWRECDRDASGTVNFDEFCDWAINKGLKDFN